MNKKRTIMTIYNYLKTNMAEKNISQELRHCYYHVMYTFLEWIYTLELPECQGTPCSKQAGCLKFKWLQRESNPQQLSWVFVYELSGCGFDSRWSKELEKKSKNKGNNRVRFNDSWFAIHDSRWSILELYFSRKYISQIM